MTPFVYNGPNAELVHEVADFAMNGRLLCADSCPTDLDVLVVQTVPEDGFDAGINGIRGDDIPIDHFTYGDMREEYLADVLAALHAFPIANKQITEWYVGDTSKYHIIQKRIHQTFTFDAANWILCDLIDIGLARAAYGLDSLYERLFDVYKAGGWPVGWAEQEMPLGKPMAVFPGNK